MVRLRRSDLDRPGIARRRRGRGFSYTGPDGRRVDPGDLDRIRRLAVPPAWTAVWICPWPNGHIQAVGTDAAGRRQYRYHDAWREQRDREKFRRVEEFGRALPSLRAVVDRDLAGADLSRRRVLAAIVRLLDVGCFRMGGPEYAEEHDTFGVASLRKEHVRVGDGLMRFDYPAKGGIERSLTVADAEAGPVVAALRRRRAGGDRLFAYKVGKRWVDVDPHDVNEYIRSAAAGDFSAKDFRTWSGTVLAAVALCEGAEAGSPTARRRAVRAAVNAVAERLGNTPAVSRSAYIDPRVVEGFEGGDTIADLLSEEPALPDPGVRPGRRGAARRRAVEEAVIQLLESSSR